MTATYFILNGPFAGEQIPYTNAPEIKHQHGPGRWVSYEPAPGVDLDAVADQIRGKIVN